jgi:hypothetical protein
VTSGSRREEDVVTADLDAGRRQRLAALADLLIPEAHGMPAASAAGVHTTGLDRVLRWRDDLLPVLERTLSEGAGQDPAEHLAAVRDCGPRWEVLTLVVAAGYYMSPEVRARLGYPGQVGRQIAPDEYFRLVDSGVLDPVIKRGPIYREPAGAPAAPARMEENR